MTSRVVVVPSFFHDQQRQLWGDAGRNMNLEESLRRGRHALQSVGDDHVS